MIFWISLLAAQALAWGWGSRWNTDPWTRFFVGFLAGVGIWLIILWSGGGPDGIV